MFGGICEGRAQKIGSGDEIVFVFPLVLFEIQGGVFVACVALMNFCLLIIVF